MALKLEWSELARSDLLTIIDYVSEENPDAAQRLLDDIGSKAGKLSDFPKIGRPGRVEGTRELVALANYIVVYRESQESVLILRVLHAAQKWPEEDKID